MAEYVGSGNVCFACCFMSADFVTAGFSRAFSAAFAGVRSQQPAAVYICPLMAQAALADGAAWGMVGDGVQIGGKLLIGPAGKLYAFASPETAARWVENARTVGLAERALMATIPAATAAGWKAKKREKLAIMAGRLVGSALRQGDSMRRAAMLAEADFALAKWGP